MRFNHLKRRDVITFLGGAAVSWPLAAAAQHPGKLPTIGFLGAATPSATSPWIAAFVQRLRELGWIEGRTVAIEYRWAEGRSERLAEFVRLKVDVIVTNATPPVIAAKQATSVIPIVFAAAGDPVGTGLVASLARPGGHVTGLSLQSADVASKRLGLLREVIPGLSRLAILANAGNPNAALEIGELQAAARGLGVEVATPEIRRAEDIAPAIEALERGERHETSAPSLPASGSGRCRSSCCIADRHSADLSGTAAALDRRISTGRRGRHRGADHGPVVGRAARSAGHY